MVINYGECMKAALVIVGVFVILLLGVGGIFVA